ncbi:cytochrome c maturation protein CcmE [Sphingomonas sp. ABOLG]|uniref:Cytochrome c-type biogenesis protein CcmE n=1 Tax=Sphingomonas olei TaxID=1886787 RepID=A0ABY2QEM3_9SPHN|nr:MULTISPECIES: cytochrome c maturation protein CcmE [Sphingomonas]MDF2602755.1 cytochrome biosis protein CcmE [Sphingomonas sp.]RSV19471.1 cytochrome c maturation protein CcmE [Sphingomonas sp. ABOLG]THG37774.1 cytochrome c maturation protein CcmE [Sphingomonas olei]
MKAKHQRLWLAGAALLAITLAALLALSGLRDQAAFFYAPSDVTQEVLASDRAVRLGGMVAAGSVARAADGVTILFTVSDGRATTPVQFAGIVPNLFREGSGVVAEGRFRPDGSFVASNLLAKHDEKYMPPELAGKMHETKSLEP